jgi:hypothetical protein
MEVLLTRVFYNKNVRASVLPKGKEVLKFMLALLCPLLQRQRSAAGDGRFACDKIISDGLGFGLDRGEVRSALRRLPGFHLEFG